MRILAASGFEAGSQFASVINPVKNAQGFASLGHDVTFICRQSQKGSLSPQELAEIYGLKYPMRWIQLPLRLLGRYRVDEHWGFARASLPYMLLLRPDVIYARSYIFPYLSSKLGIPTIAESHADKQVSTPEFFKLIEATQKHRALRLWVTMSAELANHYQSLGVPEEKLFVLPNGVDFPLYAKPKELPPCPFTKKADINVVHAGHLYDVNGIPTVLQAAALLPEAHFHFVGGWDEDIQRHQNTAARLGLHNITFYGLKPQKEVPPFQWYADALLLPYSQHHPRATWMCPLKLGEYLASGAPVIATDIPAVRKLVNDQEVHFIAPDDPNAMADGIRRVVHERSYAQSLVNHALHKAKTLSFEHRAENILRRGSFSS